VQLKIDPKGAFPVTRRKDGISRQAPLMKREWKRQIRLLSWSGITAASPSIQARGI
jgi:hypothetical protein